MAVADVDRDGALKLRLKGDVAAHGFPVAVEGKADQVAIRVHDRAAGVAARDVGAVDEAYHELAVLVGVRAKVTRLDELLEALWDDELGVAVVLLFQDAVGGGDEVVVHGVGRLVVAHGAVGEAHGGVRVWVEGLVGHELTQAAHKETVATVELLLDFRRRALAVTLVNAHGHGDGEVVVKRLLLGVVQEGRERLRAAQGRLAVHLVRVCREVALVLVLNHVELGGPKRGVDVVAVLREHVHEELAVGVHVVVLEVCVGQALQHRLGTCGFGFVFVEDARATEAHTQSEQHDVAAQQPRFAGVNLAAHGGVGGVVVGGDQVEGLAVLGLAGFVVVGPTGKERFNLLLLGLHLQALESFGLADVVLPVVRRLGILGGVLDAHGLVCVHVALHGLELEVTAIHHRRVVEVDGLFDAPAAQEAVGASWVAHDHGVVALVHARHADFQVALG